MEGESTEKEVVIVANVSVIESRKTARSTIPIRITVPTDKARELVLREGDHLLIRARKAKWFHLLDWHEMRDVYEIFSRKIRREWMS